MLNIKQFNEKKQKEDEFIDWLTDELKKFPYCQEKDLPEIPKVEILNIKGRKNN